MAPPVLAGRSLRAGSSLIWFIPHAVCPPRGPVSMMDLAGRWVRRLLPDGPHELEMNPVGYSVDGLGRDALRTDHQPHQVFAAVAIEVTTTCNEC